ncbi:ABC transporter substrate-binding protein [Halonotius aquaticus]|uniref:ABC transporter substrate-binding protein n=1 Tax=Halonotius aquaticus TaxID=2216978 RepID=A0A3A6PYW8_9EURY|nr:ABC transporter substrate-binding protein [Halonotius aquaticus]RJX43456.1 ABC transporter substrate-binding protein [Halonotius aquaticus]
MTDDHTPVSRRTYLSGLATAGAAGLAGCAGGGNGGSIDTLRVAHMPIYPDIQSHIMLEEGYFEELPVEVETELFSDGPSIVQASATGEYDVMLFGIIPAMIVIDRGIPAKITNANIVDPMLIMGTNEFAADYEESGADAFAAFEEETGERFEFGTYPPGSVPDITLRYWLIEELGLEPGSDVDVTSLGGAGPVRQALLSGQIDGTSMIEPVPTIAKRRNAGYTDLDWSGNFFPGGQPGAITLMHERVYDGAPEIAEAFVEQHIRATEFVAENPDGAAQATSNVVGSEALPVEDARAALDSRASNFISDPHQIEDGTPIFADWANRLERTEQELTNDQLFEFSHYDNVA